MNAHTRHRVRRMIRRLPGDACKLAVVLCFVFPFYWMLCTAFKPYAEAISVPVTFWPKTFSLEGIESILSARNVDVMQYLSNSVIITVGTIALQMVIMIPAAYAFARFEFFGKNICFALVLLALMIPGQITYITVYLTMADWNLLDTLWPQILPFGANAFGIFLLRQGFKQIPEEIIESAQLDSASQVQIVMQIMVPMCRSVLREYMEQLLLAAGDDQQRKGSSADDDAGARAGFRTGHPLERNYGCEPVGCSSGVGRVCVYQRKDHQGLYVQRHQVKRWACAMLQHVG